MQGERKCVTVLFADIKGSLALIEKIDSEDACFVLDGAIEVMIESVRQCKGTVNRILGDGIMAVFGAPIALEDHAILACHAASLMLSNLKQHADSIGERYGEELQVRIGLSSGNVTVRNVPSLAAIPYDVIGTTAHLASRMEQLARPNTVWMTEDTAALVEDYVDLKKIEQAHVKGVSREIAVFELVGVRASVGAFDVSISRGLSQFVGRNAEMDKFATMLSELFANRGQTAVVIGEAGVGKSRLCHEFAGNAVQNGVRILKAGAGYHGEGVPWHRLIVLLRSIIAIEVGDETKEIKRKLRATLGSLNIDLSKDEPPLQACLDVLGKADEQWKSLEPDTRRIRIDNAFVNLLRRLGEEKPTLILFEDLHRSDSQTVAVLDALCRQLDDVSLFLLINHRPHFQHEWPSSACVTEIQLSPLPARYAGELLDCHLGHDADLEELKDQLIKHSEGNPFFLEESLRHLAEAGVIVGSTGSYRLVESVPDVIAPPTVQAAIAAQIDHLSYDDKKVLRASAVLGEYFDVSLLREIHDSEARQLDDQLRRLEDLGYLCLVESEPEATFRFRHALICEVIYRHTAKWQLRALHHRAVRALDQIDESRPTEVLATLIDHALGAELWIAAYSYAIEVAKRALAQSASNDVLAACLKAKDALSHIEDDKNTSRLELDLCFVEIDAHFACGKYSSVSKTIDHAYDLAKHQDDSRLLLRVLSLKTLRAWLNGDMDQAVAMGEEAKDVARKVGSRDVKINTGVRHGCHLIGQGSYQAAVRELEPVMAWIPSHRTHEQFGLASMAAPAARAALARALSELLEFERAETLAAEALEMALQFEHPFTIVFVTQEIGLLHLRGQQFEQAISVLSIGQEVADDLPPNLLRSAVLSELGVAMAEKGEIETGLRLLEQAIECSLALKLIPQFGQQLCNLARAYFLMGNIAKASGLAEEALGYARRFGEQGDEGWIRFLIAEIARSQHAIKGRKLLSEVHLTAQERGLLTLAHRCSEYLENS